MESHLPYPRKGTITKELINLQPSNTRVLFKRIMLTKEICTRLKEILSQLLLRFMFLLMSRLNFMESTPEMLDTLLKWMNFNKMLLLSMVMDLVSTVDNRSLIKLQLKPFMDQLEAAHQTSIALL